MESLDISVYPQWYQILSLEGNKESAVGSTSGSASGTLEGKIKQIPLSKVTIIIPLPTLSACQNINI
jgi:hypothetical protein